MQIELPILFTTTESNVLHDSGLPDDYNKFDIRNITFYNIDNVSPHTDSNYKLVKRLCLVSSGGDEYICNLSYDYVVNKISIAHKSELLKCN